MQDHGRSFFLTQKIWQLSKHFLSEVANLFVRPSSCLCEGEDCGQLFRREATDIGDISVGTDGIQSVAVRYVVAVIVAVSVGRRGRVEVQMQSDSEQRCAFLQAVGRRSLEIVSERDDRVVLLRSGDP